MRKSFLIFTFSWLALISSQTAAQSSNPDGEAVILMYHHFGDDTPASTSVTLAQFDQHLAYLAEHNFNVWPLSKLLNAWQQNIAVPAKTVVLTVDDAYISVYNQAWSRVKQYGWSLSVFVNAEPVDKNFSNYMSWQQMRELQAAGFEFLNHGFSHQKMRALPTETAEEAGKRVLQQLEQNQQRLATELQVSDRIFAYPYGEYSEETANLIAEQGYVAMAQVSGAVNKYSDLRSLNRFPMAVNFADLEDFILKVNTKPLPLLSYQPFEPVIANNPQQNPPKMELEFSRKINNLNCFNSRGEPLNLDWQGNKLTIQAAQALQPPRDRYACTAPSEQAGRWFWWGHLWIIED